MDLSMPKMHGLQAIKEIKSRFPETKILTLTVHKTEEYVYAALRAGADGYVLKDVTHAELSLAIKNVLKGNRYLSPSISAKVIEGYLEGTGGAEILKLIAEGHKSREIHDHRGSVGCSPGHHRGITIMDRIADTVSHVGAGHRQIGIFFLEEPAKGLHLGPI